MKKPFKKFYNFIVRPFNSLASSNLIERMIKFLNKHDYIFVFISLLISAVILYFIYFHPYL